MVIRLNKPITDIIISALFCLIISCASPVKKNQSLYQISTINAILKGYYDGTATIGCLKNKGNFGIGKDKKEELQKVER